MKVGHSIDIPHMVQIKKTKDKVEKVNRCVNVQKLNRMDVITKLERNK